ncbi:hypothetical protein EIP91_003649 [Steccherinum ochraceum]|uniref:Cytochrome P450-dit2 n=1 Tax=Steccherinum ochraceum TaxID=92696 RepID=A0A4R0RLQ5_9APHY|nr:hypothetical protein EIP91_003649 [Steccherinum ochraceum]
MDFVPASTALLGLLGAVIIFGTYRYRFDKLRHIPIVGASSVPGLSYISGFKYFIRAKQILNEGCEKYGDNGGIFRVAQSDQWAVVVTSPQLIDELRRFPDDQMSLRHGLGEMTAASYVFGTKFTSALLIPQIFQYLGRQVGERVDAVHDEMVLAFSDLIPTAADGEWAGVLGFSTIVSLVSRMTNRVLVGKPLCRDPGFMKLATNVPLDLLQARAVVNLFPNLLKPLVARLFSPFPRRVQECKPFIESELQDRIRIAKEEGGDANRYDDFFQVLVQELVALDSTVDSIISSLFVLEFGALHTTAISFTHALFELAANPEYARELRHEAQAVSKDVNGVWNKDAIARLTRHDSFLKETMRVYGTNATSLFRKAMRDVTFSNGTHIPKGTLVIAAAKHAHFNEDSYASPDVFDPWRFVLTEKDKGTFNHNVTTPRVDYLPFGLGKHSCPGRFFAALEMKIMLAHIVVNYDVQFENGGPRPKEKWMVTSILPDRTAKVYFRKRKTGSI